MTQTIVEHAVLVATCGKRIATVIRNEGFKTFEEFVTKHTERDMLRMPGMGKISVAQIKEIAVSKGLRLGFDSQAFVDAIGRNEAAARPAFGPVQQEWVLEIPFMQQSVLFAAIRAPDGLRKDHPTKVLLRWYRRCVLYSAFDRRALTCPFEEGGGSFTGPFRARHAIEFLTSSHARHGPQEIRDGWNLRHGYQSKPQDFARQREFRWKMFDKMRDVYLRYVDEMPHHFQLHFMHAAQIVGCHHPSTHIREWWRTFYLMIVNDAHLQPESDADMNLRLSDNSDEWKKREWSPAK